MKRAWYDDEDHIAALAALWFLVVLVVVLAAACLAEAQTSELRWTVEGTPAAYQAAVNQTPLPTFPATSATPFVDPIHGPSWRAVQSPIRPGDSVTLACTWDGTNWTGPSNALVVPPLTATSTATPTTTLTRTATSTATRTPTSSPTFSATVTHTATYTYTQTPTATPMKPPVLF